MKKSSIHIGFTVAVVRKDSSAWLYSCPAIYALLRAPAVALVLDSGAGQPLAAHAGAAAAAGAFPLDRAGPALPSEVASL